MSVLGVDPSLTCTGVASFRPGYGHGVDVTRFKTETTSTLTVR